MLLVADAVDVSHECRKPGVDVGARRGYGFRKEFSLGSPLERSDWHAVVDRGRGSCGRWDSLLARLPIRHIDRRNRREFGHSLSGRLSGHWRRKQAPGKLGPALPASVYECFPFI